MPNLYFPFDKQLIKIDSNFIIWIESAGRYSRIVTDSRSFLPEVSMARLERELVPYGFFRIHRSYIVSLHCIEKVVHDTVSIGSREFPLARTYYPDLLERLIIIRGSE